MIERERIRTSSVRVAADVDFDRGAMTGLLSFSLLAAHATNALAYLVFSSS